jgi:hypothetical protein
MMNKWIHRSKVALHVLRGHPTIYNVHFEDGITLPSGKQRENLVLADCLFTGSTPLDFGRLKRFFFWVLKKLRMLPASSWGVWLK